MKKVKTLDAVAPRLRLLVDCPACEHEQTEPFTDEKALPVGKPFPCWNCGQPIEISREQERRATLEYSSRVRR